MNKVAADLKNIQLSIWEKGEAEAPTNLVVAISLMSAVDEETYHMASFHLERESSLTLKAVESVKPVEKSSTNNQEAERLNIPQRAYHRYNKKCFHRPRTGHIQI